MRKLLVLLFVLLPVVCLAGSNPYILGSSPQTYWTNFSEYTTGQQPYDWTERWGAANSVWTVETGTGLGSKELRGALSADADFLLNWDTIPSKADVEILAKVLTNITSSTATARIFVRASGADGAEYGYFAALATSTDRLYIRKIVNGSESAVDYADLALDAATWYCVRFRINGTSLKVKAWADADCDAGSEPAWQKEVTDSDISSAGWTGVGDILDASDPKFDYFAVGIDGAEAPRP